MQAESPPGLAARRQALAKLAAEQWDYTLSQSPEFASMLGDRRWNDKVSDVSDKAIEADEKRTRQFVARLSAIDTTGFPEQEALTHALLLRRLEETLENARFAAWEMAVTPFSGVHLQALELVGVLPFQTAKDYDDYVARLKQLPRQFDDTIAAMRKGMTDHLMPSKYLLDRVAVQLEGVAGLAAEKTRFAGPLQMMPRTFSEPEQKRIREAALSAIRDAVQPAYRRFARFVRDEYAPRGRVEPGLWSLPDGGSRYAAAVKHWTTTRYKPEEIHQLGLALVGELEGQLAALARKAGSADVKSFQAAIETDRERRPRSPEDVLERYRNFIARMGAALPTLFGRRPRAGLTVVPVDPALQGEAPAAEYQPGSPDGSRLGRLVINPGSPQHKTTVSIETTAYHEGVPGHHMQVGIAQEIRGLPPIRRQFRYAAFSEGWAIYAERLAKDIGFFADPYSDYGRAHEELLRCSRLVADTGLHAKRWSRDQAASYLRDHGGLSDAEAQRETDRMIYRPAEALGYEIGALKILQLRERARKNLASRYRLARFHDAVLGAGSIPLDLLEERIDRWIASEKAAAPLPSKKPSR